MKNLHFLIISFFVFTVIYSQPFSTPGNFKEVAKNQSDCPFGHMEYLPEGFSLTSGDVYPLIIYLHGLGEKGNGDSELFKLANNGVPKNIKNGSDYPAIMIAPQSSSGWFSTADFKSVYDYAIENFPVNLNKVYVTGISAGGGGTWQALAAYKDLIAAAVPICGARQVPNPSEELKEKKIWAFHNFTDNIVGLNSSISNFLRIVNQPGVNPMKAYPYSNNQGVATRDVTLKFKNNTWELDTVNEISAPENENMSFTIYAKSGHDAWTATYANQDMWDWLFTQTLENPNLSIKTPSEISREVLVFPNPNSGFMEIKNTSFYKISRVKIYSVDGTEVYSRKISNQKVDSIKLEILNLSQGTYIMEFFNLDDQTSLIKKIIITK